MKPYAKPHLMKYGRVEDLTRGSGGSKPDFIFNGTTLVNTNTNCSDTSPLTTSCLVVS